MIITFLVNLVALAPVGLFRSQAEKQYQKMAGDFELLVGRIARSNRQEPYDLEPFEGLHSAWNEYMREHGRIGLTDSEAKCLARSSVGLRSGVVHLN